MPRVPTPARDNLATIDYAVSHFLMTTPIIGYAEGYYGRLLSWAERARLLATLQSLGMNTYYYAPKEDPWHRFDWRTPYPQKWLEEFQGFCHEARQRDVIVVAGVAPGLDFDFSHLPDGEDFRLLVSKCAFLLENGARAISLLMDDIDTDFSLHAGGFTNEGEAHASLANALGNAVGNKQGNEQGNEQGNAFNNALSNKLSNALSDAPLETPEIWVTPRIYADELIADAPNYLPMFVDTLAGHHTVLYCGSDVVSQTLDNKSQQALCIYREPTSSCNTPKHRVILWDNLYANDYCPRRLFVGAWRRRKNLQHVLLNPTGMINTDCLLLALMADGLLQDGSNNDESSIRDSWKKFLSIILYLMGSSTLHRISIYLYLIRQCSLIHRLNHHLICYLIHRLYHCLIHRWIRRLSETL